MSYQITITRSVKSTQTVGKNWERVASDDKGNAVYGYTPEIEKVVEVNREIYRQTVDGEIDLMAVIKAFNNAQ